MENMLCAYSILDFKAPVLLALALAFLTLALMGLHQASGQRFRLLEWLLDCILFPTFYVVTLVAVFWVFVYCW